MEGSRSVGIIVKFLLSAKTKPFQLWFPMALGPGQVLVPKIKLQRSPVIGWRDMQRDALRILRGERRDDGHAVAAERGKGFEIGRDARPAAWVKTGN
jgi:hypothetical protein